MAALGPAPDELLGLAGGPPPGAPPSIDIGGPPGGAAAGPAGPPMGGGPPPGGGGLPPELASLMGGGDEEGGAESRSEVEILGEIRDLCVEYMDVASDDIEKDKIAQVLKTVQGLFASNQQQTEAAQGTTPAMKGMAKAISG